MQRISRNQPEERPTVVRAALAAGIFAVIATLVGCNTTAGVGRDIENLGDGLEDAAESAKD